MPLWSSNDMSVNDNLDSDQYTKRSHWQNVQGKSFRPLSCCYVWGVWCDQIEENLPSHLDQTELTVKCEDSSIPERLRPSWHNARFCQRGSFHWVIPSMSVTPWYQIIQTNVRITAVSFPQLAVGPAGPHCCSDVVHISVCACVCVCLLSISHLRLCVDIGSIIDQLFDDFRLASQWGYVQSSVSFLDYMEQPQECVLSSVAPVPLYCLCVCHYSLYISMSISMNNPLSPTTLCTAGVPALASPCLLCQQCVTSDAARPTHKWSPAEPRP